MEKIIINNRKGLYFLLFILAAFMHLYKLADIPYGLHIDEAGMAYDAYCLANYSVDRYLNHYPVYLINFGGGQSALLAYLVAGLIKVTGIVNHWIIRLPGAIISILAYVAGVNIIRKCMGEKWGMLSGFFLAVFPYFIMQSRFGLDCNLLLGISTISIWFLLLAQEKNKALFFALAGGIWGICYYTYALSYIGNTVFLVLLLFYWLYMKKITWKQTFCFCAPLLLIAMPLLLMIIINTYDLPQIETRLFTIPRIPGYRSGDIIFSNIWGNFLVTIKIIFTNDWLPYNAFDRYYTLYPISIIFGVVGCIALFVNMVKKIVRKEYSKHMPFMILLITYLMLGTLLGGDGPNINRLNGIFFALFYAVLYGMKFLYGSFNKIVNNNGFKNNGLIHIISAVPHLEKKLACLVLLVYVFCSISFIRYYFLKYPTDIYPQRFFADTFNDITEFIETSTGDPKVVYTNASYVFYFLGEKIDPFDANIPQEGTRDYWKYVFELPSEIEMGAIYVIRETWEDSIKEYMERLEEAGFEKYKSGMFRCYYKK